jgi:O-antigen/teichoic acid export membrane protein
VANRHDAVIGTNRTTVAKVIRSSAASTVVSALAGFFVLPRVLHGVDVTRYGEWATLAGILAIGQLAEVGVGTDIARRVATAHGQGDSQGARRAVREGTTVLVGIAALLEITGVCVARPVVDLVFTSISAGQRGQLTLLLIGMFSILAVGLVSSGYFGILAGLQRTDYGNWSGIASVIVGAGVTVGGVAFGLGLWALLLADAVQLLVSWAGPVIGMRRVLSDVHFGLMRVSPTAALSFIGMPTMIVLASAGTLFDSQIDKLVLAHYVGPKASAMFQIGSQLVLSTRGVALIPVVVLLAGTAELYRSKPDRLRRLEALAGRSAQAIASVTAGGLLIFSSAFLRVWLGPGFAEAALSLRVLAIAALLNMWSAPWIYYALGRGRYHYVLIAASVNLVVNASCTIFLTTRIGLPGALIGSVSGNAAGTLAGWLVLRRWEHRHWLRPALRATAVVAIVVGPLMLLTDRISASWLGLVGWGSIYLIACSIMLLVTRSLPVTVVLTRGRCPRLSWWTEPVARPRSRAS